MLLKNSLGLMRGGSRGSVGPWPPLKQQCFLLQTIVLRNFLHEKDYYGPQSPALDPPLCLSYVFKGA